MSHLLIPIIWTAAGIAMLVSASRPRAEDPQTTIVIVRDAGGER